ncbi:MAG: hypothetical protein LEGION0403_FIIPPAGN_02781 [Legionella sp.]|uniref:enhanced serine sensitivity protein SseB C-terminal domain-containing protein n=1 Tax=Legionella sp. TaxID=459 RepID=UPI003D0D4C53
MSQLMLYQPKEKPLDLLSDLKFFFTSIPEINQAYYCKASLAENGGIAERTLIAVEVEGNKDIYADLKEFNCLKNKYKEEVIYVHIDESPFNRYFRSELPFYKRGD